MSSFSDWNPSNYEPVIAILLTAACFSAYWFIAMHPTLKVKFFTGRDEEKAWINYVVFQKMTGVLFLGVIPGIIVLTTTDYSLSDLGINFLGLNESLIYSGIMGALILLINFFASNNPERLADFPQMRVKNWTIKILSINSLTWFAYLFAYEFLFRGVLLFLCYATMGFWPAVAVNIALYATTHIPKGAGETIGTFPYGLLLCYVTISTGSIFVAFATHLIMALSNDVFSIYHSKEMKIVK
ncbi:MAG: CPBP family intramembrane metalloprotease [Flammeovirgaceae bacterium]|nr:CPBP family intramembrane metalloprotease [Flammeovirgaceae bacterium]